MRPSKDFKRFKKCKILRLAGMVVNFEVGMYQRSYTIFLAQRRRVEVGRSDISCISAIKISASSTFYVQPMDYHHPITTLHSSYQLLSQNPTSTALPPRKCQSVPENASIRCKRPSPARVSQYGRSSIGQRSFCEVGQAFPWIWWEMAMCSSF